MVLLPACVKEEYRASETVQPSLPLGLVRVSAVAGSGIAELRKALRDLLQQ